MEINTRFFCAVIPDPPCRAGRIGISLSNILHTRQATTERHVNERQYWFHRLPSSRRHFRLTVQYFWKHCGGRKEKCLWREVCEFEEISCWCQQNSSNIITKTFYFTGVNDCAWRTVWRALPKGTSTQWKRRTQLLDNTVNIRTILPLTLENNYPKIIDVLSCK